MIFGKRALIAFAVLCLAACDQNEKAAEPTIAEPIPTPFAFYQVKSFRNAVVQASGSTFTVRRAGEDRQGFSILPVDAETPVRIDFTVDGGDARVSYYRNGRWTDVSPASTYGLRLGNGGAFHILVEPASGQASVVTVTGTTTCRGAPEETCPVLP